MDNAPPARRGSIVFLQAVVVLVGIVVLALMLWEPNLEGRNAHATLFEVYFKDPFLAYAYLSSIAFFVALFQAFTLLGYIGQNKTISADSVRALRIIKYCAISLVVTIAVALAYIVIAVRDRDDPAGGVAMGLLLILIALTFGTVAAVFERRLQSAVDTKS